VIRDVQTAGCSTCRTEEGNQFGTTLLKDFHERAKVHLQIKGGAKGVIILIGAIDLPSLYLELSERPPF
jgi:hypothetical protein